MSEHGSSRLRPANRAPHEPAPPAAPTGITTVDVVRDVVHTTLAPFTQAPPPEQGTAGVIAQNLGGVLGLVGAPAQMIDAGIASLTAPLAALFPSLPAATLLDMHVGLPHAHLHPPSLIPPAPPVPLPSFGVMLAAGCVSVLIGGIPAARCGDMGLSVTCGSLAPPFEVFTGSSNVFIGGARAARMGDITFHCNPGGGMGFFAKAMAAAGAVAGIANAVANLNEASALEERAASDSGAEAANASAEAAGKTLAAAMAAAQVAADAAALALTALCGKDPGIPPGVGAVVGGTSTVLIGGMPLPALGDMIMGKVFEKIAGLARRVRRRGAHPDANGHCGKVGEPVDVITGAVFDRYLDGVTPGGFRWERHYTSARAAHMGPLGHAVRHSLQHELRVRLHRCVYVDWRGREVELPRFRRGESRVARFGYVLERLDDDAWRLTIPGGTVLRFERAAHQSDARLVAVTTAAYHLAVAYDRAGHFVGFTEHHADAPPRVFRARYDDAWRLVALESSADGDTWRCAYAYSREGDLVVARDAAGHDARYDYDHAHRLTAYTDRRGYTYRWRYDAVGRCTFTSGEDGLWLNELDYHPERSETRVTTAPGVVWTYHYDAADGFITRIVDPYGGELRRVRDDEGRLVREVDWAGRTWEMRYDGDGAHVGRVDPYGNEVPPEIVSPVAPDPVPRRLPSSPHGYVYGALARVEPSAAQGIDASDWWAVIPEAARPAAMEVLAWRSAFDAPEAAVEARDALGRLVYARDVAGREQTVRYDPVGNEVERVDGAGRVWRREVARWNLLGASVDPLGRRVCYEYTATEKVARVVDAGGAETRYAWDAKDRMTEVWRDGRLRERYVWDRRDRLVEKRDPEGRALLTITPGEHGMPEAIVLDDGARLTFAYDRHGRVTEASTDAHAVTLRRDEHMRRLDDLRDGLGVVHDHRLGDIEVTRVLGRYLLRRERQEDGSVCVYGPSARRTRLRATSQGAVLRETPGGTTELLQYDDAGRMVGRVAWRADGAVWSARYLRNGAGELVEVLDSERGATRVVLDAAGRVEAVQGAHGERERYQYDIADNVLRAPGVTWVEVGEGNQVLGVDGERIAYDARDRVASRTSAAGRWTYRYDSFDQLIEARYAARDGAPERVWRATYDGLGRRIAKALDGRSTTYWWDGDRIAAERGPDGALRVYEYASPEAMAPMGFTDYASDDTHLLDGRAYAVFHDPQGMPLVVEDDAGCVVWRAREVYAYGALTVDDASVIAYAPRWPGHWWDDELGLQYNRFRYYEPRLGRYTQRDPLGIAGGVNLYGYATNPLHTVDLVGLHPDTNDSHSNTPGTGGRPTHDADPKGAADAHATPARPRPAHEENIGPGLHPNESAQHMDRAIRETVKRAEAAEPEVAARRAQREADIQRARDEVKARTETARARDAEAKQAQRELSAAERSGDPERLRDAQARNREAREAQNNALGAQRDAEARSRALQDQQRNDPAMSGRVYEAAYDPTTGRMVVAPSGNGTPPTGVNLRPKAEGSTTTPGMCGMTQAAGIVQDGRAPERRGDPIHVSNGGYSFHSDAGSPSSPTPYSHRTTCQNCGNALGATPNLERVGTHPPEVQQNPRAHPPGSGEGGAPNVRTNLETL